MMMACSDYGLHIDRPVYTKVDGELHVDRWTAVPIALDIVVVVDESMSMNNERTFLYTDTMPVFTDALIREDEIDWCLHHRATWMDFKGYGKVCNDDPDPLTTSANLFSTGASIYGGERGFDSIAGSQRDDDHTEDADVWFWVISDEADQSHYNSPATFRDSKTWFKQAPYNVYLAASVITNPEDLLTTCNSQSGESYGEGYVEAADLLYNICQPNTWFEMIEVAVDTAKLINASHTLQYPPDIFSDMECAWGGIEVHNWDYHDATRTVTFDPPPPPGTHVSCAYMTAL